MKLPSPEPDWPESWTLSHGYDRMELGADRACAGYASAYAIRRRRTLELVRRAAAPGARVLDVAAGQGNFSLALAELGYDVTWNDLRAELAGYVRRKHVHGRIAYAPGNIFELGCAAAFDVVLAGEVIEHVAHPDRFLARLAQLAKPGGHVVVTTPNGGYFRNRLPRFSECADPAAFESRQFRPNADGHIFLLHADELRTLARAAGLEPVDLRLFGNPLTSGHVKTERLLRVLPAGVVAALEAGTQRLPRSVQRRLCAAMAVSCRRIA